MRGKTNTYSSDMDISGHNHISRHKVKKHPRLLNSHVFSAGIILNFVCRRSYPVRKQDAFVEFQENFQSTCTIQLELRTFPCIVFTKLSVRKVSQIRAGAKLNVLAFVPSINFVFKEQAQLGFIPYLQIIRKPLVCSRFQWVWKWNIGAKWVNSLRIIHLVIRKFSEKLTFLIP